MIGTFIVPIIVTKLIVNDLLDKKFIWIDSISWLECVTFFQINTNYNPMEINVNSF